MTSLQEADAIPAAGVNGEMSFPRPVEIASDEALPREVDVAIVGGGIIGSMAALSLAERGLRVALFEKGRVAAEQSCRNWGFCRVSGRDMREVPLAGESLRIWDGLSQRVGHDLGFRRKGQFRIAKTGKVFEEFSSWLARAREHGVKGEMIDGATLRARLGCGVRGEFAGALFTPEDGRAEPQIAAPRIAEAARANGRASIHQNCAVRAIGTAGGRVASVATESGEVKCGAVLVAGGNWSSLFLKPYGIRFPQLSVRATAMRVMPASENDLPMENYFGPDFGFRRNLDGSYTLARGVSVLADLTPDYFRYFKDFLPAFREEAMLTRLRFGKRFFDVLSNHRAPQRAATTIFEKVRTYAPEPHRPYNADALAAAKRTFPGVANAKVLLEWAGYIDATPDAVPAISAIDAMPGLYLASGFSGHGFGIGPGAGEAVAALIAGEAPAVDLEPFAFTRFTDGRRLIPEAGI